MAEISSVESWMLRLQESDRIFYQKINQIRAQMGMPPAKPPSYDNKKQDPEPVIVHPKASGSRLQSMEENLKRMKTLVLQSQQIASSIRSTTTRYSNYEEEQEIRDSEHSDKELNTNLEANPAYSGTNSRLGDNSQEREILVSPSYGPIEPDPTSFSSEISELLSVKVEENQSSAPSEIHQDAFIKNTSAYQVIRKSHQKFEDDQPDSLQEKRSSAPTLSNLGIDLNFKLGLDDRRALSPSTEQQKSDFRRGISTFPQTEFLDFDGMQLSWVRSVNGFDGIIECVVDSVETIELNLVDSMEFLETPSARKVFVEMPNKIVMWTALVDAKITNENGMEFLALQLPYDRGKCKLLSGDEDGSKFSFRDELVIVLSDVILTLFASGLILFRDGMVIFDPGGGLTALDSCPVMLRGVGKSCLFLIALKVFDKLSGHVVLRVGKIGDVLLLLGHLGASYTVEALTDVVCHVY